VADTGTRAFFVVHCRTPEEGACAVASVREMR
jgi:hypothetical protein